MIEGLDEQRLDALVHGLPYYYDLSTIAMEEGTIPTTCDTGGECSMPAGSIPPAICDANGQWNSTIDPSAALPSNERTIHLIANVLDDSGQKIAGFIPDKTNRIPFDEKVIQLPLPTITIGFVNGVLNDKDQAGDSLTELRALFYSDPVIKNIFSNVITSIWNIPSNLAMKKMLLYNANNVVAAGGIAAAQSVLLGMCVKAGALQKPAALQSLIAITVSGDPTGLAACGSDMTSMLTVMYAPTSVQSYWATSAKVAKDLLNKANQVMSDSNARLLMVAHSQGTAYSNQIYSGISLRNQHRVGLVQVASIATAMADGSQHWTTAENDQVIKLLRFLDAKLFGINILGPNPTNLENGPECSLPRWDSEYLLRCAHHNFEDYTISGGSNITKSMEDIVARMMDSAYNYYDPSSWYSCEYRK